MTAQARLLTVITMVAFAMNSILNRAAVDGGHADAVGFALVRVLAGAVVLGLIVTWKRGTWELTTPRRWGGAVALALYMIGFSLAYVSLDAGLGALILFGTVQIVLFAHTALTGTPPSPRQTLGAAVAFGGLIIALWPEGQTVGSWFGAFAMLIAGGGWAAYTLAGRGALDPIAVTATHFLLCLPCLAILLLHPNLGLSSTGWVLAILAGGVTSGLGYSLWYHVLPGLPGARAAIVQLSVPILAIVLGALILGESIALKTGFAAALVVGGIGLALSVQVVPTGRK
ncbi:MAG: DMT family transporter [Paracoccaceae bacterium]